MPAIDLVQWSPSDSRPVFAYRYPETNISNFAQLIVHESQEAILFSKGRLVGKYGPGKHTLSTENLPVLRDFFKIPFGKNPFFAEVWFVNKLLPLNIDWNTGAMMHHDPDYMTMVPIRAHGRYGLRVDDAERFLIQLVGTAREFTAQQLTDHFKGELESKTKTAILQFMLAQRIGIKSINACLAPLSDALQAVMIPFWEQYGFGLAGFYVTSVEVDNDGEAGRRILDAMGRQSAQVIAGYSWQQERALDVAKEAARHSGGGLLGALMMTNLVGGAGNNVASLAPAVPALPGTGMPTASGPVAGLGAPRRVFCSQCSRQFSSDMKFCPHCGDPYTPCPQCGSDNDKAASRCVSCGIALSAPAIGDACRRCKSPLASNVTFCPNCGDRVTY